MTNLSNNTTLTSNTTLSLHSIIVKFFKVRSMNKSDIENFLSWDLSTIPDLVQLKDLRPASERIISAINNNEKFGIYGDYDVDGTTSCALLFHFFKSINVTVEIIQPNRVDDGYGLHNDLIDKAIHSGIKLLITVDCGITNNSAAQHAKDCGLDLIITDHHKDISEIMPTALAIINPNRRDESCHQHLKGLAGVGVAFALTLQLKNDLEKSSNKKYPSIYSLLQFVALGTICDMAPLNSTNIRLIRHGLKLLKDSTYPGLRVFLTPDERNLPAISSEKLSFNIGPMINSKGRLDHAEMALKLLTTDNAEEARALYSQLEICNNDRKFIQGKVFKEAKEQIKKQLAEEDPTINIVYDPNWHEGVIGIVASKLVEEFKIPAIVFSNAKENGIIKGSARSAGELNLLSELNSVSDLFTKYGGHNSAAGMALPLSNLPFLQKRMQANLKTVPASLRRVAEYYDLEIKAEDISPKLVKDLELLEPFGIDNQKPIFKIKYVRLDSFEVFNDVHVRWNFSAQDNPSIKLRGMSFNFVNGWGNPHPKDLFAMQTKKETHKKISLEIYFNLGINRFKGNEYIQLQVKKIEFI